MLYGTLGDVNDTFCVVVLEVRGLLKLFSVFTGQPVAAEVLFIAGDCKVVDVLGETLP